MSNNQVKIAAGTLYGAIENLLKLNLIEAVKTEDHRRKVYVITEKDGSFTTRFRKNATYDKRYIRANEFISCKF